MQPNKNYVKVEEDLKLRIILNEFQVNEKIPSERKLSDFYGVQRPAVREALLHLCAEGYIYNIYKKGYYVSKKRIKRTNQYVETVAESVRKSGQTVEVKITNINNTYMNRRIAKKFKMEIGVPIITFTRYIFENDTPVAIEHCTLLKNLFDNNIMNSDLLKNPDLYSIYRSHFNISVFHGEKKLKQIFSNEDEEQFFKVKSSISLLKEEGLVFDLEENPIEFVEYILLPDRFIYTS